jgi:hypothetical protein
MASYSRSARRAGQKCPAQKQAGHAALGKRRTSKTREELEAGYRDRTFRSAQERREKSSPRNELMPRKKLPEVLLPIRRACRRWTGSFKIQFR